MRWSRATARVRWIPPGAAPAPGSAGHRDRVPAPDSPRPVTGQRFRSGAAAGSGFGSAAGSGFGAGSGSGFGSAAGSGFGSAGSVRLGRSAYGPAGYGAAGSDCWAAGSGAARFRHRSAGSRPGGDGHRARRRPIPGRRSPGRRHLDRRQAPDRQAPRRGAPDRGTPERRPRICVRRRVRPDRPRRRARLAAAPGPCPPRRRTRSPYRGTAAAGRRGNCDPCRSARQGCTAWLPASSMAVEPPRGHRRTAGVPPLRAAPPQAGLAAGSPAVPVTHQEESQRASYR